MAGASKVFPPEKNPLRISSKNNRDGTFTDVTAKAGLLHSGWGQGVCVGDYDNDGFDDLFVTTSEKMFSTTTTATAPSPTSAKKPASPETASAGTPVAPSWTRSRRPPRSLRRQLHRSRSENGSRPRVRSLPLQSVMVACGPPGLNAEKKFCITTMVTAPSPTSARNPAF